VFVILSFSGPILEYVVVTMLVLNLHCWNEFISTNWAVLHGWFCYESDEIWPGNMFGGPHLTSRFC